MGQRGGMGIMGNMGVMWWAGEISRKVRKIRNKERLAEPAGR
jgi:hypothetical protein